MKQYAPTLLLFGGSGFIGGKLIQIALDHGWKTIAADTRFHEGIRGAAWSEMDITWRETVETLLDELRPDAVVNLAAIADIDLAEREKDLAWRVNVLGAELIAEGCARWGIRQIFFSSDAVFDGSGGPYQEGDPTNPVNYYGLTKAEAEKKVLAAQPDGVIVRVSLVLGYSLTSGNSFLAGLETRLESGQKIVCPVDEIRTPVDVLTLCESVLELAGGSFEGVLHIGCLESVDRYELTRRAAQEMGYSTELVRPQETVIGSTSRAARHKNGVLDVSRAQTVLTTPMLNLDQTIKRAVSGRNRSA